ncbi:hypothetical protein L6164_021709 [Bauhinia variegata]|uniref:Uncharacterized protein n=1 Tax=Bauhinia variegata TaxID=167791 RepID=A0ACB9N029_BAUVA|nr:hypothetical protein L6164_021709 [Bauhinia variegata]
MDPCSFVSSSKRPPDPTYDPPTPTGGKRRPHPPPPPSPSETLFRILCPTSKTGALIGKAGSVIRQFRELTGAKIYVDDSAPPSSDERVIVIVANHNSGYAAENQRQGSFNSGTGDCDEGSPAQQALIRVFERMVRVDDDRPEEKQRDGNSGINVNNASGGEIKNLVACRLLAQSNQVGCVLGRGGKIVEKIRQESGAQVRVLPKDQLPACASSGDELIQVTGNFAAVKKAILSVSSCLQDNPRVDAVNSGAFKPSGLLHGNGPSGQVDPYPQRGYASGPYAPDHHSRGYSSFPGPESIGAGHRMFMEEEVVFKLLCQQDKVGSLIGKGGSIVRALQNETGASIKIADAVADSDERVVVISARENSEQKISPAQEAVARVHCRIAEIGFEPGAAVVARLLVHSQQIGCLLGKGGLVVSEMRRATGASIRVFPKEQVKCASQNEEVVQVIGNLQSVQDALFHITSRIRETIFPIKTAPPNFSAPPHLPPFPEMPPPLFRPRNHLMSSGHPPQVGPPHGVDHSPIPSQSIDPQHTFLHGLGRGPPNMDRVPYPHGYEGPNSPRSWNPQAVGRGNPGGTADASRNVPHGRNGNPIQNLTSTSVEVTIPQVYLTYIYGENNSSLIQIRQISGAKVTIHDPKPGAAEGLVILSGAPEQTRAAQSLIQAFIFCGQTAA